MTHSSQDAARWVVLAHLLRPQGRKGELLGELFTDFPDRFQPGSRVFLAQPGFSGPESGARAIAVNNHWLPVGRNQGRIVLSFDGIGSIEQAEQLAGLDVLVPIEERVELDEDAAPLLTVAAPAGDEILIPFVQSFLIALHPEARRIEMSLPPGLIELNRP